MRHALVLGLFAVWGGASASADQFWVAYEGNDLPTNEVWFRNTIGPPAELELGNGLLTLDSSASVETADLFEVQNYPLTLAPDERLIVEWSVSVAPTSPGPNNRDVVVTLATPDQWILLFSLNDTSLQSPLEPTAPVVGFQPGLHEFRVVSSDLRTYALSIDGTVALQGAFYDGFSIPRVAWGDGTVGASSLSQWDYFRFGVVPEPSTQLLLALGIALGSFKECAQPNVDAQGVRHA